MAIRKELEDLIFLGKIEEEVELFNKTWKLKTLDSEEQLDAVSATSGYDNISRINAIKTTVLARALTSINGIKLGSVDEKVEFLNKLQLPIINQLYTKYEELQKKQDEALKDMNDIKN